MVITSPPCQVAAWPEYPELEEEAPECADGLVCLTVAEAVALINWIRAVIEIQTALETCDGVKFVPVSDPTP